MKMPQPTTLDSASNKCFLEPRWMLQFLQDTFLLSLWSSAAPHIRDTGWGHTLGWPGSMGTALSSSSRESGSNILNYTDKTSQKFCAIVLRHELSQGCRGWSQGWYL